MSLDSLLVLGAWLGLVVLICFLANFECTCTTCRKDHP